MSRSRDVVEVIGRTLADEADDVTVVEREDKETSYIELSAGKGGLGRMIGRQGRTAGAIRALAELASGPEIERVVVDFVDES